MKRDVKEKWVAALRSGEYRQTRGVLHDQPEEGGDRYCCLGVLCQVALQSGLELEVVQRLRPNRSLAPTIVTYNDAAGVLPSEVVDWAGLVQADPYLYTNQTCGGINDRGTSFADIAALIEKHL